MALASSVKVVQVITADQEYAAIDLQGEGSRSGANQARDGEGKGSSSDESQGQDRGEGSASGENQGGDRNANESQGQDRGEGSASGENQGGGRNVEGSGSSDDEDEHKPQRRVRGDIEHGRQESNKEEIDFSSIHQTFMAINGAVTVAVFEFHKRGAVPFVILRLVIAINVFGFLCSMTSMLHRNRIPWAARILGIIGVAAAGLGFLLLVSVYISSYWGWILLGLGSLAILVICVWAFRP